MRSWDLQELIPIKYLEQSLADSICSMKSSDENLIRSLAMTVSLQRGDLAFQFQQYLFQSSLFFWWVSLSLFNKWQVRGLELSEVLKSHRLLAPELGSELEHNSAIGLSTESLEGRAHSWLYMVAESLKVQFQLLKRKYFWANSIRPFRSVQTCLVLADAYTKSFREVLQPCDFCYSPLKICLP